MVLFIASFYHLLFPLALRFSFSFSFPLSLLVPSFLHPFLNAFDVLCLILPFLAVPLFPIHNAMGIGLLTPFLEIISIAVPN